MSKRKSGDYEYFHERLTIDFKRFPPKSKEELKLQMLTLGYHIVKDKVTKDKDKVEPTDNQLKHAWDFLTKKGYIKRGQQEIKPEKTFYKVEMRGKQRTYRATEGRMIYSKKTGDLVYYRKGQFIPKQEG